MIVKSYEIKKNKSNFLKNDFFLLYGENLGLKKDIKDLIKKEIKQIDEDIEVISLYENEILSNENSFYDFIYSGSLFSKKKLIIIYDTTDKIFNKISDVYDKYPENIS